MMPIRLGAAAHVFVSVIIIGTLWRLTAYHLLASSSQTAQHVGGAMVIQY